MILRAASKIGAAMVLSFSVFLKTFIFLPPPFAKGNLNYKAVFLDRSLPQSSFRRYDLVQNHLHQ